MGNVNWKSFTAYKILVRPEKKSIISMGNNGRWIFQNPGLVTVPTLSCESWCHRSSTDAGPPSLEQGWQPASTRSATYVCATSLSSWEGQGCSMCPLIRWITQILLDHTGVTGTSVPKGHFVYAGRLASSCVTAFRVTCQEWLPSRKAWEITHQLAVPSWVFL